MSDNVCPGCLSRNRATRFYITVPGLVDRVLCRHHWHETEDEEERIILALRKIFEELEKILAVDKDIRHLLTPKPLVRIHLRFGGTMQGPITLNVGQSTVATVLGFNADGSPFTGPMPAATYVVDNTALDSVTPGAANDATVVSLADGTANFSVSLTTAEGVLLSDSTVITNVAVTPPQVLTSVKLDFSTPTP